jgi:hypothetical protein
MDVKLEALPSAPGDPTAGERRSLRVLRALSLVLQLASDMWLPSDSLYHLRHQRLSRTRTSQHLEPCKLWHQAFKGVCRWPWASGYC